MNDAELLATFRWVLEGFALAALLTSLFWLKSQVGNIPERIPVHFGITGKPDRWGSRWTLVFYVVLAVGLYVGMSIGGGTLDLIAGQIHTSPKERFLFCYVKVFMVLLFFYVYWITIQVARGKATRFNLMIPLGIAAATAVPAILLASK